MVYLALRPPYHSPLGIISFSDIFRKIPAKVATSFLLSDLLSAREATRCATGGSGGPFIRARLGRHDNAGLKIRFSPTRIAPSPFTLNNVSPLPPFLLFLLPFPRWIRNGCTFSLILSFSLSPLPSVILMHACAHTNSDEFSATASDPGVCCPVK